MRRLACTISGSMNRSLAEMAAAAQQLDGLGVEILSPRSFTVDESKGREFIFVEGDSETTPSAVQARHLASLAASDFVWLVCPEGYVGLSAAQEIGYALALGVPVLAGGPPADTVFAGQVSVVDDLPTRLERLAASLGSELPELAAFDRLQRWTLDMARRRGFADESVEELLVLICEEIGELLEALQPMAFPEFFDAVRQLAGEARMLRKGAAIASAERSGIHTTAAEIADLLIELALVAERAGVRMSEALRDKSKADSARSWA